MNEISNFCSGECATPEIPKKISKDKFNPNNPPYAINNGNNQAALDDKTITADAIHNISIEYNVHNLFGLLESWATHEALEKVRGARAFVISRSTFASSGRHTGHWTGDTNSEWSDLYYTIPDMINFNFYGIPFIGADICGFNGDTTEELCARWIEVGAFYPFSRDHNAIGAIPQELYVWPLVANISRFILNVRYSLLPYYYTLFYKVHAGRDGTVIRPLFFEFPTDLNTYSIDRQFLVGKGLLVSPVLEEGATTVTAYFPDTNWFDFYTFEAVPYSGSNETLPSPIEVINLHIRGGEIIPLQEPSYTTYESRQNPFSLIVPFESSTGTANGTLYIDDGDSLHVLESGSYTAIEYRASLNAKGGSLSSSFTNNGYSQINEQILDTIYLLGVECCASSVTVNGKSVTFAYVNGNLQLDNLNFSLGQNLFVVWN